VKEQMDCKAECLIIRIAVIKRNGENESDCCDKMSKITAKMILAQWF